jgi:hypothetical protein
LGVFLWFFFFGYFFGVLFLPPPFCTDVGLSSLENIFLNQLLNGVDASVLDGVDASVLDGVDASVLDGVNAPVLDGVDACTSDDEPLPIIKYYIYMKYNVIYFSLTFLVFYKI